MHLRPALLITLLLAAISSHAGGIYKWVDDKGQVHYSQTAPANVEAEVMQDAPPPADDPNAVRGDLQRQLEAYDERRAEQDEAFAEQKKKAEITSIRKKNCETARKNLANLHQGGNKAYMTPEGEVVRLTDDERAKRIATAKQNIKDNCED
ncbi:MAG: DUF4124 domain-containing protein [Pseudomonadota bacterium]